MKRSVFVILLALAVGGLVAAQQRNTWDRFNFRGPSTPPETLKVTGTLGIQQGMIALQDKDINYYILGLERFIGFIDGLKEGANVSIEGYAWASQKAESRFLRAAKLTLNNKEYDLVPSEQWFFPARPDFPNQPRHRGNGSPWHGRRGY
ncbi:MAG: hypothetical protein LBL76_03180 [Treponema sp.]|jgi:hypothetical protein|nr:hypothetical protein [Treponema sp.]